jgi:hypothetical protein
MKKEKIDEKKNISQGRRVQGTIVRGTERPRLFVWGHIVRRHIALESSHTPERL